MQSTRRRFVYSKCIFLSLVKTSGLPCNDETQFSNFLIIYEEINNVNEVWKCVLNSLIL